MTVDWHSWVLSEWHNELSWSLQIGLLSVIVLPCIFRLALFWFSCPYPPTDNIWWLPTASTVSFTRGSVRTSPTALSTSAVLDPDRLHYRCCVESHRGRSWGRCSFFYIQRIWWNPLNCIHTYTLTTPRSTAMWLHRLIYHESNYVTVVLCSDSCGKIRFTFMLIFVRVMILGSWKRLLCLWIWNR